MSGNPAKGDANMANKQKTPVHGKGILQRSNQTMNQAMEGKPEVNVPDPLEGIASPDLEVPDPFEGIISPDLNK